MTARPLMHTTELSLLAFGNVTAFTRFVLENAGKFEWSIQGLGMLRLYITSEIRLHVWDGSARRPDVSTMHDHPWDFESTIISGRLLNRVYDYDEVLDLPNFMRQQIQCGPGGGMSQGPSPVSLVETSSTTYVRGDVYTQVAEDIHESVPSDGTVTLIRRWFKPDTEHAHVFYPIGSEWVSAEPRVATLDEVRRITSRALQGFPS